MSPSPQAQSTVTENIEDPDLRADAQEVIDTLRAQLDTFETFVARRFDEVSMEINATSQLVNMAEEGISDRFSEIIERVNAIAFTGEDANSPANTGLELDKVIKQTEEAANTILDNASTISDILEGDVDWSDDIQRKEVLDRINACSQDILMACSFQDLTGQRISQAVENLKSIKEQLATTLQAIGIDVSEVEHSPVSEKEERAPASQDDIDALFSENRKTED